MAVQFKNPVGGMSPLGKIIVVTPGTTVPLNTNVGTQGQGANKFASRMKQVIFDADPRNAGIIYVCWNSFIAGSVVGVFCAISPGQRKTFPDGGILITSSINVDNLCIDADVPGDGVYASVIYC